MQFRGRVIDQNGRLAEVRIEALDASAAHSQLSQDGATVLRLAPVSWQPFGLFKRSARLDIGLFTEELITLLEAGLTLGEALETLTHNQPSVASKQLIERVYDLLKQGQTFSAALRAQGKAFPILYCSTVQSAEKTGQLAEALGRYLAYQRQIEALRKQVISASIYPSLLIGLGTLVIGFLLAYVVPRFATVYQNAGREAPWSTQLLLNIGTTLGQHSSLILSAILVFILGTASLMRQPRVRAIFDRFLWGLPGVGEPLHVFHLARFYRSLGMLLEGGIPLVQALAIASPLLGGPLRPGAERTRDALVQGQSVALSFKQGQLTTPVAERLLRVGESSGRMPAMMQSIARFMDEATARHIGWISHLFEPLLMVVIGLTIGLIVVLLYMPIFDLTGVFQ